LLGLSETNYLLHEQSFIALQGINLRLKAAVCSHFNSSVIVVRGCGAPATFGASGLAAMNLVQEVFAATKEVFVGEFPAVRIDFAETLEFQKGQGSKAKRVSEQ